MSDFLGGIWNTIILELKTNDFMITGLIAAIIAYFRGIPRFILNSFLFAFTVSVEITDREEIFYPFRLWLSNHPYNRKNRRVSVTNKRGDYGYDDDIDGFIYSPSPGYHLIWLGYRPMILYFERIDKEVSSESGGFNETYFIRILGRDKNIINKILQQADIDYKKTNRNKIMVTINNSYGDFRRKIYKDKRSMDSIFIDNKLKESIIESITYFLDSKSWYNDRGVPYRLGCIFHGVPGNGKTSMVHAIASHFNLDISVINIDSVKSDSDLISLFGDAKTRIVLLEDIDRALSMVTTKDKEGVTYSGLLNAIDGIMTKEGLIIILTTNNIDSLNDALLRSGRMDMNFEFPNPSEPVIEMAYKKYFSEDDLMNNFIDEMYGRPMSDIQEALLDRTRQELYQKKQLT